MTTRCTHCSSSTGVLLIGGGAGMLASEGGAGIPPALGATLPGVVAVGGAGRDGGGATEAFDAGGADPVASEYQTYKFSW